MTKTQLTCRHARRLFGMNRARLHELEERRVITAFVSGTNRKSYRPEALAAAATYANLRRRGVSRAVATAIAKAVDQMPDIVAATERGDRYLITVGEKCRKRLLSEHDARDALATLDKLTDGEIVVVDLQPTVEQITKATAA